jgi:hypothetical protein
MDKTSKYKPMYAEKKSVWNTDSKRTPKSPMLQTINIEEIHNGDINKDSQKTPRVTKFIINYKVNQIQGPQMRRTSVSPIRESLQIKKPTKLKTKLF